MLEFQEAEKSTPDGKILRDSEGSVSSPSIIREAPTAMSLEMWGGSATRSGIARQRRCARRDSLVGAATRPCVGRRYSAVRETRHNAEASRNIPGADAPSAHCWRIPEADLPAPRLCSARHAGRNARGDHAWPPTTAVSVFPPPGSASTIAMTGLRNLVRMVGPSWARLLSIRACGSIP